MLNYGIKIDNNDTSAGVVVANEYNSLMQEQKNSVTPYLSLNELDNKQQAKAIDIASKAMHYIDTGTVNAVQLSRGATTETLETLFNGMVLFFTPSNTNTGPTTLKVKTLTAKPLFYAGAELGAGYLNTSSIYIAIYDLANDRFNVDVISGVSGAGGGNDSELFIKPDYEIPLFVKISPNSFKVPLGTSIVVGGTTISLASDITLSLNTNLDVGTKTAGTDYYVYARADSTFYISANKTILLDRLIGGFHYSLVPENEVLTGNKTEADMVNIRGINAYSFWDLKFRPISNPDGMVHVGGKWYDIYLLNSEHIVNGTSKANLTIAGGVADANGRAIPKIPLEYGGDGIVTYGKLTWFQTCEIAKSHAKELIDYAEFTTIAYGVNEQRASQVNAYEVVVGKIEHYPNLTSKYGIEQATGTQWIGGKDVGGNRDEGSISWAWRTGLTDNRGNIFSLHNNHITAVLLGGFRSNSISSGSRTSLWRHYVWASDGNVGCRFACDHLKLA